jgi:hypothetical protein
MAGESELLKLRRATGRPGAIPQEVIAGISTKISEDTCEFKSYNEIAKWVEDNYQVAVKYQTLHKQLHYRMKTKLKVPRRVSNKKDDLAAIELKKKLEKLLQVPWWLESVTPKRSKNGLFYWCQGETIIGLKTIERQKITARGIKPIGKVQWNFKAYYLYGAVAPQTGESIG